MRACVPAGRVLVLLFLTGLVACSSPTILRVDSDPPGADLNIDGLGFVGATPQEKRFTDREIERLGGAAPGFFQWVASDPGPFNITLSMRGYIPVTQMVTMDYGERKALRIELPKRLETIEVTSDPSEASVYKMTFDKTRASTPAREAQAEQAWLRDPIACLKDFQRCVTLSYLGKTSLNLKYNPADPLVTGDYILFRKDRYEDKWEVFDQGAPRLHAVMQRKP